MFDIGMFQNSRDEGFCSNLEFWFIYDLHPHTVSEELGVGQVLITATVKRAVSQSTCSEFSLFCLLWVHISSLPLCIQMTQLKSVCGGKKDTVWSVYSPNSSGKCLCCSLLNGQCYIQPAHFQNGLPLFCVVKCLPVYKRLILLENHPGGFGIHTLNGITLPLVSLWDLAQPREAACFHLYAPLTL